jgi:hypothetical protein
MNFTTKHDGLRSAIAELEATGAAQVVEIPANIKPEYYQKYAHTLASRWQMRIATRAVRGPKAAVMMITERAG